jgi:hypothetical protein
MSYTYNSTFTRVHAKALASKVVADLYQCYLLYDLPSEATIKLYEEELTTLLADCYVETYEFGFQRGRKRVLTWHYTVGPAGDLGADSRSGNLTRGISVSDAEHFNFLTPSQSWWELDVTERKAIEATLPFCRTKGSAPSDGEGYWKVEHAYSAGGVLVERKVFRPW